MMSKKCNKRQFLSNQCYKYSTYFPIPLSKGEGRISMWVYEHLKFGWGFIPEDSFFFGRTQKKSSVRQSRTYTPISLFQKKRELLNPSNSLFHLNLEIFLVYFVRLNSSVCSVSLLLAPFFTKFTIIEVLVWHLLLECE